MDPQLWHACAGSMVQIPPIGTTVFYFPQGHADLNAFDFESFGKFPSMFLCRVTAINYMADPESDEVFAKLRLLPLTGGFDACFNGSAAVEEQAGRSEAAKLLCSPIAIFNVQECCVDSSGCLVVYSPVDVPEINMAVLGEDPSCIPLLPSGFMISPDGRPGKPQSSEAASASSSRCSAISTSSGSLITIGFQILAGSCPMAKLNLESVTTVNNLIGTTIHQIRAALDCLIPENSRGYMKVKSAP